MEKQESIPDQPQKEKRKIDWKKLINYFVLVIITGTTVYLVLFTKMQLDKTVEVVTDPEKASEVCADDECIVFDAKYSEGWVNWEISKIVPLLRLSISTETDYEEDENVQIVCPIETERPSMDYLFDKFLFVFDKKNTKNCSIEK
ncbi:hypothetical protein JW710_04195 [Candidatus Dojkabacteria bacterium]|nr:hypothetical protein [Candidatus Dojkabacteria bacterium]